MTPIQRRACLLARDIRTGKFGPQRLIKWFVASGESDDWEAVEFSRRQLARLARIHRKYRRQVCCADVLFWAQRLLAEQQFQSPQEELCPAVVVVEEAVVVAAAVVVAIRKAVRTKLRPTTEQLEASATALVERMIALK